MTATEERGQWGRQLEFLLTMVGYAVGLGNVWRFPHLCYKNGGGAFLIPYVICLFLVGIPIFALECALGQFGGKGPVSVWTVSPAFQGIGVGMLCVSCIIFTYYNVIIAWALRYFIASMTSHLPWVDCNDCDCLLYANQNSTTEQIDLMKTNNTLSIDCPNLDPDNTLSPSEIYFKRTVLHDSGTIQDLGEVQWPLLLANFVAFFIIFLVLYKGIQSLGKVVYFTATIPYILLTILLIRVAMLPGARKGVEFYLTPRWEKLKEAEVWSDAATQIFFSLSACLGGLIAMSSYNKFSNNIFRDALTVPIINCLTSFYSGFVVFSTLGNMSEMKNIPIDNVTTPGSGLAFIVYPEALGNMPISPLWAILFFFTLCILGFSTQFSSGETIMTSILDEFPRFFHRKTGRVIAFRISVCLIAGVLGIPLVSQGGSHLLDLVDESVIYYPLLFIGLSEFAVISYVYGYNKFADDMKAMLGRYPSLYFKFTWTFLSPILLLGLIVFTAYQGKEFEVEWAGAIYYLEVLFCLIWIPVIFFVYTCRNGLWQIIGPKQEWKDRRLLGDGSGAADAEHGGAVSVISDDVNNKGGKLYPTFDDSVHMDDMGRTNAGYQPEEENSTQHNGNNVNVKF